MEWESSAAWTPHQAWSRFMTLAFSWRWARYAMARRQRCSTPYLWSVTDRSHRRQTRRSCNSATAARVRSVTAPPWAQERQIRSIRRPSWRVQFSPTMRMAASTLQPARPGIWPVSLWLHGRHTGSGSGCEGRRGTRCVGSLEVVRWAWSRSNGVGLRKSNFLYIGVRVGRLTTASSSCRGWDYYTVKRKKHLGGLVGSL